MVSMPPDDQDFDPPNFKPAFLDEERAEQTPYCGEYDVVPTFDGELLPEEPRMLEDGSPGEIPNLPALQEDMPARGKGPSRGYEVRWDQIARLHSMGYTNNQIARHLGYSPAGISLALKHPHTESRVQYWRDKYMSQTVVDAVKDVAADGIKRIHKIILDPAAKESVVLDASKWAVEKATGKAKQEVSVQDGSISGFMELLKQMQSQGEVLDVTPVDSGTPSPPSTAPEGGPGDEGGGGADTESNSWGDWISKNL